MKPFSAATFIAFLTAMSLRTLPLDQTAAALSRPAALVTTAQKDDKAEKDDKADGPPPVVPPTRPPDARC